MRWPHDGPRVPGPGVALLDRIGRLPDPPRVHRLKWRWMLDWWDRRRASKRRGVRVG